MNNTWEDISWETTEPKEWLVEYLARSGSEVTHHITALYGTSVDNIQSLLMNELRRTYAGVGEIEVTIIRMEEVDHEAQALVFSGSFTP
ncbi:MAG: hypothetical protein VW230_05055 [Candidatus Poseidoniales archaeon]